MKLEFDLQYKEAFLQGTFTTYPEEIHAMAHKQIKIKAQVTVSTCKVSQARIFLTDWSSIQAGIPYQSTEIRLVAHFCPPEHSGPEPLNTCLFPGYKN